MLLAMLLGMAVLGSFLQAITEAPAVVSLGMALSMTAPMAAWMRYRGHPWCRVAEMAGAMLLPAVVLIGLLWTGAVDAKAVLDIQHAVMIPSMLAAMTFRRSEYSNHDVRAMTRRLPRLLRPEA
jgi:hypothetical protein